MWDIFDGFIKDEIMSKRGGLRKDWEEFSKTISTIIDFKTDIISIDKGSYINIIHYIYIQYK